MQLVEAVEDVRELVVVARGRGGGRRSRVACIYLQPKYPRSQRLKRFLAFPEVVGDLPGGASPVHADAASLGWGYFVKLIAMSWRMPLRQPLRSACCVMWDVCQGIY